MNPQLLNLLRCPKCKAQLRFHSTAESGESLICEREGDRFPIDKGVPRLSGEPYVASFGRQWNRYDVARNDEDEATFAVKTGIHPRDLAGKLVLDAGCGGGRYAALIGRFGGNLLGLDLSSAVDKAAALCAAYPNVLIAQGDLLNVPVVPEVFDLVFSIGVLHHSPDPREAFAQVAARVKPGGTLAVWLYRKNTLPQELINQGLRAITTRTSPRILEWMSAGAGALGSVPVLKQTLNKVANFSNHPDWTLRVCDNFDWYAPQYQSHHTIAELEEWFKAEGFEQVESLAPAKSGRVYDWAYHRNLIIGSGVNIRGAKALR